MVAMPLRSDAIRGVVYLFDRHIFRANRYLDHYAILGLWFNKIQGIVQWYAPIV